MKIRMRRNHQQVREADRLSGFPDYGWSALGRLDGERVLYSNHDWEPVPQEAWAPVRVPFTSARLLLPNGCMVVLPKGFRLRPITETHPNAVAIEMLVGPPEFTV